MKKWFSMMAGSILLFYSMAALAALRIDVLLLDGGSGGSYHNWKAVTPILKAELDKTGIFDTEVLTDPPGGATYLSFTRSGASTKLSSSITTRPMTVGPASDNALQRDDWKRRAARAL
jgi:hypothetical protein